VSETRICPRCAATVGAASVRCGNCGEHLARAAMPGEWTRRYEGRMVAGVCAGLAARFGISVTVVRLAFALGALVTGLVPVGTLYAVLWLIMPLELPPDQIEAIAEQLERRRGLEPPR
jgi:phage shock protein PspC (stress-responsive transcriptional regulator)